MNISIIGRVKEKYRVIKNCSNYIVNSNWAVNTPDFHNDEYREKIVSVTFIDKIDVPSNTVKSWDVSADGKGGVIAYITLNEEDSSNYNLFIAANGDVIGNEDSSYVFFHFTNLVTINFNNCYDTSNVTNLLYMFNRCENLLSLDINSFDTSKALNMYGMFANCFKLKNLKCDKINTSSVRDMSHMFSNLRNLSELDITNFNTENVNSMLSMFYNFGSEDIQPKILDLSSFDTRNVTNMKEMFYNSWHLNTIYVSDKFVTTNIINSIDMFYNNLNLIGGNGTVWDINHIDKGYARIDTVDMPGYFTLKQN